MAKTSVGTTKLADKKQGAKTRTMTKMKIKTKSRPKPKP